MSEPARRLPVILVVDDEPAVLAPVARDLRDGFGERYRIVRAGSGEEALEVLRELVRRGGQVALLVADQRMPGLSGTDYLVRARELVPTAKRVLLTAYADTEAAIQAINEHVDEEDPSPRREIGQHPTQQEPHGAATGGDRAPDRQRLRAILRVAEGRRDDRQDGRHEQRAPEPLQPPPCDEHRG